MINAFSHYKALIFDMDGTLFKTEPIHLDIISSILAIYQIDIPVERLTREVHGLSDPAIHQKYLLNKLSLPEFLKMKNTAFKAKVEQMPTSDLAALKIGGVDEFLTKIAQMGIPMGVVTASESAILNLLMEKFELTNYFKILIGRESTFLSKPSPSPYFLAMRMLKATPSEVVIFEDSDTGMLAATASGARVIRITEDLEVTTLSHSERVLNYKVFC